MKKKTTGIFLVCYLAYLFIYVARLNLSMAAPGMKQLQILTMEQLGILGSVFSVVYACGRLASGILSDRLAPWKMICTGLMLCGISKFALDCFLLLGRVCCCGDPMLWHSLCFGAPFFGFCQLFIPRTLQRKELPIWRLRLLRVI